MKKTMAIAFDPQSTGGVLMSEVMRGIH